MVAGGYQDHTAVSRLLEAADDGAHLVSRVHVPLGKYSNGRGRHPESFQDHAAVDVLGRTFDPQLFQGNIVGKQTGLRQPDLLRPALLI